MAFEIPNIPVSKRLNLALLLSLLIHALLLSLTFGGQGRGLPGIGIPWQERRFEAPDLRVALMPMKVTAAESADTSPTSATEPLQQAKIKPPVTDGLTVAQSASPPATPSPARTTAEGQTSSSFKDPPAQASTEQTVAGAPMLKPSLASPKIPAPVPAPLPVPVAETILPRTLRSEPASAAARHDPAAATDVVAAVALTPIQAPPVIAVERAELTTFAVPAPPTSPLAPMSDIAVAPSALSPESVLPTPLSDAVKTEATKLEAERQEAARQNAAQLEAQRQQDARLAATKLGEQLEAKLEAKRQADRVETARVEAAKLESAKIESAKAEVARQEAARTVSTRLEAARLETQRQEIARLTAAQLEAQRNEIARQGAAQAEAARETMREAVRAAAREAARLDTERQEGARQAAAQIEAARALAEKEEDAKRDARRQAMGRVLNEEAAQRKVAEAAARSPATSSPTPTSSLPYSLSTARRARLWGRTDPNAELVQYAEAWARKIESNTPFETVRDVAARPHTDPMLTVAIRRDGSVESVTFVLSSGVAEVDEAIRRIVQSHASYRAFPPALAREVDVIEIRRTWHFDIGIRLY